MAPEQHRLTALAAMPMALTLVAPGAARVLLRGIEGHGWHGGGPMLAAMLAAALIGAWFGVTAPDTLEIAKPVRQFGSDGTKWRRVSIIPHRTLTHWWPLWVALLVACLAGLPDVAWHDLTGSGQAASGAIGRTITVGVTAFALGGLLHLLGDLPNPSGIPRLSPFGRTVSLRWWRSDAAVANTVFAGVLVLGGCLVAVTMLSP